MTQSIATVQTSNASRYLQQLCKHWSHKFEVSFTPEQGTINFGNNSALSLTAADNVLTLKIDAPDIRMMEDVVSEHLQRFANKEQLSLSWNE